MHQSQDGLTSILETKHQLEWIPALTIQARMSIKRTYYNYFRRHSKFTTPIKWFNGCTTTNEQAAIHNCVNLPQLTDSQEDLVLMDQTVPASLPNTELIPTVVVANSTNDESKDNNGEELTPLDDMTVESKQICVVQESSTAEPMDLDQESNKPGDTGKKNSKEEELPPAPPKKSLQTNQKLKRLQKIIKSSIPGRVTGLKIAASGGQGKVERKSLKDKMEDGDLAAFLKERRAVSESRFKVIDRSPSPGAMMANMNRTKSDLDLSEQELGSMALGGIRAGNVRNVKEHFERMSPSPPPPPRDLKSPTILRDVMNSNDRIKGIMSPSPERNGGRSSKQGKEDIENSTTSPESGVEGGGGKSDHETAPGSKKKGKKSKDKDKKERKRHSGCEACNSDREHREHKREKKRAKKEKRAAKENGQTSSKKVTIVSDTETKLKKSKKSSPGIPPYPKGLDMDKKQDGFFNKLLVTDGKPPGCGPCSNTIERSSRPHRKKSPIQVARPTFNTFLKEKKVVTESKFRRGSASPIERGTRYLPPGTLQGESFFEHRSKFENGNLPVATFPRSLSNLERRSNSKLDNFADNADMRPSSAMSGSRASSLPRPTSGLSDRASLNLDQEEYKNYVLEILHSTQKSPRFQQLQAYYNILDRALKLEKRSANMDIHKLRSDAVVDFETWRQLRHKEKARDELDLLLSSLREAQRARQFHFRPKEAAAVRWRGDIRLRGRERSVDNLKNHFTRIAERQGKTTEICTKIHELQDVKDSYRPLWRGTSVAGTASSIQRSNACSPGPGSGSGSGSRGKIGKLGDSSNSTINTTKYTTLPQGRQGRSRSSLTIQQVTNLKDQLSEIFSSDLNMTNPPRSSSRLGQSQNQYEVTIAPGKMGEVKKQLEQQKLFVKPLPEAVKKSQTAGSWKPGKDSRENSAEQRFRREEKQRDLSKRISQEIRQRTSAAKRNSSSSPKAFDSKRTDSTNDYLLILTPPSQRRQQVHDMVNKMSAEAGHPVRPKSADSRASSTNTVIPKSKDNETNPKKTDDNEEEVERPKSVSELRKSFENIRDATKTPEPRAVTPLIDIDSDVKVVEMKKSFEKSPKAPQRTSSFYKAVTDGSRFNKESSLGKLSKSTSSLEDIANDNAATAKDLLAFNDMSMSNPDLSDTEGKSYRKHWSRPEDPADNSMYLNSTKPLLHQYNSFGSMMRTMSPQNSSSHNQQNVSKYSRAYLNLVKSGDVNSKLSKFEPESARWNRVYSPRTMAHVYRRKEELTEDYVKKHLTDLSKVVIKTKEMGDIEHLKKKLLKEDQKQSQDEQHPQPQSLTSSWQESSKAKLKHLCKKVSHSKILSKMVALQCGQQVVDRGAQKLAQRAQDEETLHSVFKTGKVLEKRDQFEPLVLAPPTATSPANNGGADGSKSPMPAPAWSEGKLFSWSKRFDSDLPAPSGAYTSAQKHNQFRKYFGYRPDDASSHPPMSLDARINQIKQPIKRGATLMSTPSPLPPPLLDPPLEPEVEPKNQQEPTSLPTYMDDVNKLPPPPPIRSCNTGLKLLKPITKMSELLG